MTNAAKSILVYGVYLLVLGVILVLIPNVPLSIFGIPTTHEVWIRVIGVMAGAFGNFYVRAARAGMTDFFRWTVASRIALVVFFIIFVAVGLAPINLLLLGAPDIPFVAWTVLALRADGAAQPATVV